MRFQSVIVSALLLCGAPAWAQIAPDDIWANTKAAAAAMGVTMSGDPRVADGTTRYENIQLRMIFPLAAGSATMTLPDMIMTDAGDGKVAITYPSQSVLAMNLDVPQVGIATGAITLDLPDINTIAEGVPGDIRYLTTSGPFTMTLTDVSLPEIDALLAGSFEFEGYTDSTRIEVKDMVHVTSSNRILPMTFDYEATVGNDLLDASRGMYGATSTDSHLVLVPGGADILNLSEALRAGMSWQVSTQSDGSQVASSSTTPDSANINQIVETSAATSSFGLDATGLVLEGTTLEIILTQSFPPWIEIPVVVEVAKGAGRIKIPVLSSPQAQDADLSFDLDGLRFSPGLWAMIDPNKSLNRSPARVALDLKSSIVWGVDTLDVMNIPNWIESSDPPFEPRRIEITDLALSALGAVAQGTADFTVDPDDPDPFEGIPALLGKAKLEIMGLNAAVDQLLNADIVSEDDLGFFRLGLGMTTRQTGPDTLEAEIEFKEDGQIFANGQRMR